MIQNKIVNKLFIRADLFGRKMFWLITIEFITKYLLFIERVS